MLAVFSLLASSSVTWAKKLPGQFLKCTGYGETLNKPALVPVTTTTISKADLMNGENLTINFYDVVGFRIDFKNGKFQGHFTLEDTGRLDHAKFEFDNFSRLNKINRQYEIELTDPDSGNDFWRLTVKCEITGN